MGEKSVGEKSWGQNRGRWDAGFRSPLLRYCYHMCILFKWGIHTHSPNEPCFFALQFYIGSKLQLYWGVSGFDPAGFDSCSVVWFSASSDLAGQPRWHTVALRTLGGQNLEWSSNPQIRVNFGSRVIRDYPPLSPRNPGAPGFFPESLCATLQDGLVWTWCLGLWGNSSAARQPPQCHEFVELSAPLPSVPVAKCLAKWLRGEFVFWKKPCHGQNKKTFWDILCMIDFKAWLLFECPTTTAM